MATTYVGYRRVLAGDNVNNWIGPKGKVGVYSNFSLLSTSSKVFQGMPDNEMVLGVDGKVRRVRLLEYIFAGRPHIAPMYNAGGGVRVLGARFRPLEYKGTDGTKVFLGGFGHIPRTTLYSVYSNLIFFGLDADRAFLNPGHARRFNSSYGGAFDPFLNKGVAPQALATTVDYPYPASYNNPYGKNRILEWRGVPSARAL